MHKIMTAAALAAAVGLAGSPALAEDYPEMTLRMAHPLPEVWPGVEWDKWWAEEVSKRSGGKINIEIFWAGQLGNLLEIKGLVESGAVDLGVFAQAVHASEMPMTAICAGLLNRVSANPETAHTLAGECYASQPTVEEQQELNLKPLRWTVTNPYRLLCNTEIKETADLEGLKVRAVGGAYVPIWMEAFGMVPTRVQATEIREGLQRGTLDCNFGPIEWVPIFGLQTVAPYLSDINTGTFTTFQLWTPRETFESWPESVQQLMIEVGQESMVKDLEALPAVRDAALAAFKEADGQIIELADMDKFAAQSPDMIDVWIKRMTDEGLEQRIQPIIPLQRKAAESFQHAAE
ncbi:MAG: TRAP transporter substrate-binding protein DctP [Pseudomonadota bacterium]